MNTIKDNPALCGLIDALIDVTSNEIYILKRMNGDRLDSLDEIKERVAQRTREVATAAYQAGMIDGKIKNLGEMEKALRLITTDDGPEAA
jgi:hypothetical protein